MWLLCRVWSAQHQRTGCAPAGTAGTRVHGSACPAAPPRPWAPSRSGLCPHPGARVSASVVCQRECPFHCNAKIVLSARATVSGRHRAWWQAKGQWAKLEEAQHKCTCCHWLNGFMLALLSTSSSSPVATQARTCRLSACSPQLAVRPRKCKLGLVRKKVASPADHPPRLPRKRRPVETCVASLRPQCSKLSKTTLLTRQAPGRTASIGGFRT